MGLTTAMLRPDEGSTHDVVDDTTRRILDATLELLLDFGIERLRVEDVAKRAGVARITIYRRFDTRDHLLQAVLLREGQRLFARIDEAVAGLDDPEDRLVEGFVTSLVAAREHPLVVRTFATEPELLAEVALTQAGPLIAVASEYLAGHVRRTQAEGHLSGIDARQVAELAVRLATTFLLAPQSSIPNATEADLRALARQHLVPLFHALEAR